MNDSISRPDITNTLVHFVKGEHPDAYRTFRRILQERRLIGGTGFIKGGYRCVCFSEAPVAFLYDIMVRSRPARYKYQPFGILVSKEWLFAQGGRPVIYQPDEDYLSLPESMRWRHVRYEPLAEPPIDFTWEREWRIPVEELRLTREAVWLAVPNGYWADALMKDHEDDQDYQEQMYTLVFDAQMAQQLREQWTWSLLTMDALSMAAADTLAKRSAE